MDEIKENDYNLNIPRYVDTFEEEEVTPLPVLAKELKETRAEIEKSTAALFEMFGELRGNSPEINEELAQFRDLLK